MSVNNKTNDAVTAPAGDRGQDNEHKADKREARSRRFPMRKRLLWAVGLLVGLATVGSGAYAVWQRLGPEPVMPTDMSRLDPELVALIKQHANKVRKNRRDSVAHGRLGLVYEANAMFDEARRCYASAVELVGRAPLFHYHLAIVLRQTGDVHGALNLLRTLAEKYPNLAPLHHRLGVALLEAGHLDEAETAFQAARDLSPSEPTPIVGLADVKLRRGDYVNAAALLNRAIKLDPEYKAAHYSLGIAYRGLGRLEEAARELRKGLNARPRFIPDKLTNMMQEYVIYPAGRIARANVLVAAGQTAQAATLLEKGLATRPDHLGLMTHLARAYMDMARHEEALALLLRVLRENDGDWKTYINLARCYMQMSRYEEALGYVNLAVTLGSHSARSYLSRASVLRAMGRHVEALPDLEAAVRREVDAPELYIQLGATCCKLERHREAKAYFAQAAELSPELLEAHLNLSVVCIRLGQLNQAAEALNTARRLAPSDPQVMAIQRRLAQLRAREPTGSPTSPST